VSRVGERRVLGIVIAGERGADEAPTPLNEDRAEIARPFGGCTVVDFALSNLVNADIRKILVLTQ